MMTINEIAFTQTSTQNYIVTTVPYQAVSATSSLSDANSNTTIQYFDGLGRLSETVQEAITPSGADLIAAVVYDNFGREAQRWLPGALSGNNGAYVSGYTSLAQTTNGGDANPYSRTDYEASPLNRVTGQYGPGTDWYNNGKKETIAYTTNSGDVKLFTASGAQLTCSGFYTAGTLYGQKNTDEDGHTLEIFTDKQGRKILSRANGNADTYYVYDDLDNLRYVLPPLASDQFSGTGSWNNDNIILKQYAYIYRYDWKNRVAMKRLPGCDSICLVYDNADRLILSQDGNQRLKSQWIVNKYDVFGRLLYSGLLSDSRTRGAMDSTYSGSIITETYSGSGPECGYTCTGLTPSRLLTVNYYDNYGYLKLLDAPTQGQLNPVNQSGYTYPDTLHVKTLLTGTRIYHLDNPAKYETTAIYYDKYGRTVQTRATNHMGGYDITCNLVDFTGKPTATYTTHSINGTTVSASELLNYTYDKAQRLLTITSNINNSGTVPLVTNTYDKLGRLQAKVMGGTVDTTSYAYNVRSWLTAISSSHFTENLYYETNSANLPDFSNAYNGNIAGMQWSLPAENLKYNRVYTFGYDGLNRLTDGTYCGWSGSMAAGTSGQYTETYSYDKMGNITNFVRYGLQTNTPAMSYGMIDNLTLAHNGNQLTKVTDNGSDGLYYGDEEYQVNTANSGNCRAYDANGNTLYDTNSDIWGIRYNLLNLPDTIQFYQGHQILYHYSAVGTKQEVTDKTSPGGVTIPVTNLDTVLTNPTVLSTITTDYLGNAVYRNDTLLRILLPTGYWQGNTYYYYLKDHLGSNREVLSQTRQVVEYSDYYPSGMRFGESVVNGGNVQPYRHTGMEMQGMHGLNWIDNEARMRSVNVPEFTTIDPLAEMYYGISPYGYCADNPIYYVDPDGMTVVYDSKSNSYTIKGDDIYAYWGYLQDINNGTGSMENMLKACNAAAQGNGNGENGTNLPTTMDEISVIGFPQGSLGTITPSPPITNFEFWLNEKTDNIWGKLARGLLSMAYTVVNSPAITLTGRTWGGAYVDSPNDRILPLVDMATWGLSASITKLLPIVEAADGLHGFNTFMKANKGNFTGKGWQIEASQIFKINSINKMAVDNFSDSYLIMNGANTAKESFSK
ncbi:DUF6443 domain-containing protein [Microbacter margulisiae]|uniref:RHS repeat-associated protein n=1 Tax=Microbacter margulisiae TaxID=1350067 RepID=A0A7W5DS93_9PORP|nr:DUF6443 domain-containing protein [Microbacter margulisiae]MBB3187860.1 RHS repeat-associated protein [Microbacter margulisiae]